MAVLVAALAGVLAPPPVRAHGGALPGPARAGAGAHRGDDRAAPRPSGRGGVMIELDRVTVTYADAPGPVLRDVDLRIDEGELALVVGRTGVGKSTLLGVP